MPKYVVETLSMFRMRYVIESDTAEHAMDEVTIGEIIDEFGQKHLGETIISARAVSDEEIPELFFEDAPYLKDCGPERAFKSIHKVKYD